MKQCCDKCYTNYTEHDYPAHTIHDACLNLSCLCHQPCANHCHFQEPYGFVPEADCEIHDKKLIKSFRELNNNKVYENNNFDFDSCYLNWRVGLLWN